eukprot:UN13097
MMVLLMLLLFLKSICVQGESLRAVRVRRVEDGICDIIQNYIPSFCTPSVDCLILTCDVSFYSYANITTTLHLYPCKNPAEIDIEIKSSNRTYLNTSLTSHQSIFQDIGLDFGIPGVGNVGIYLAAEVEGNAELLVINIGFDR